MSSKKQPSDRGHSVPWKGKQKSGSKSVPPGDSKPAIPVPPVEPIDPCDDIFNRYHDILSPHKDIEFSPHISDRKLRKAMKAYGGSILEKSEVKMLIDNTIFRSAKDGMMLTKTKLLARSGIGGELILQLSEINTVEPSNRSHIRVPISGLEINGLHFVALPGLALPAKDSDQVLLGPLASLIVELSLHQKMAKNST